MQSIISKRAKAPWHTGLIEGAVWGGVVSGVGGIIAAAIATTASAASLPALTVVAAGVALVANIAGFATSVNKVIEKREAYQQAGSRIQASTASLESMLPDIGAMRAASR